MEEPIEEFVCLKPKIYSIVVGGKVEANFNEFTEEQSPPRNAFIDDEAEVALDADGETAQPETKNQTPMTA